MNEKEGKRRKSKCFYKTHITKLFASSNRRSESHFDIILLLLLLCILKINECTVGMKYKVRKKRKKKCFKNSLPISFYLTTFVTISCTSTILSRFCLFSVQSKVHKYQKFVCKVGEVITVKLKSIVFIYASNRNRFTELMNRFKFLEQDML